MFITKISRSMFLRRSLNLTSCSRPENSFCNLFHVLFFSGNNLVAKHISFIGAILKRAVMQMEKALINDRSHVSKVSGKFRIRTVYDFCTNLPVKFRIFKKM